MPVAAALDASQGIKKIKGWQRSIAGTSSLEAAIEPLDSIEQMSRKQGRELMKVLPANEVRATKTAVIGDMKRAMTSKRNEWRRRARTAYRKWAVGYVEALWGNVQRGGWGRVKRSTRKRKQSPSALAVGDRTIYGVRKGWKGQQLQRITVKRSTSRR